MAVYARGYRPYEGELAGRAPAWTIFRQGVRAVFRSWSFRILSILILVLFVMFTIVLYTQLNVQEFVATRIQRNAHFDFEAYSLRFLRQALLMFYGPATVIGALTAILAGAGIVSDDLRTRALPLYLVRPIRPIDYALGKALVLPALLTLILLLPGLSFYLFAGLWQPSGTSSAFLWAHLDVVGDILAHYTAAALGFSGLMLLLSSRTPRRGSVIGWSAAIFFVGAMLAGVAMRLGGSTQAVLKHVSLILNAMAPLVLGQAASRRRASAEQLERIRDSIADPTTAMLIAGVLFLLGLYAVYRRARTAEVAG